jgi:hypothetical protein
MFNVTKMDNENIKVTICINHREIFSNEALLTKEENDNGKERRRQVDSGHAHEKGRSA